MSYNTEVVKIDDYLYRELITYNNSCSYYRESVRLKMVLNSSNFNFSLCKTDGSDIRVLDQRNGVATLNMWIAKWDINKPRAIIFFDLPYVDSKEEIQLLVCWGNKSAANISSINDIGFILCDNFKTTTLSSKWSDYNTSTVTSYGYKLPSSSSDSARRVKSTTSPLVGVGSWVVEFGVYGDFSEAAFPPYQSRTVGLEVYGPENPFVVGILTTNRIRHNAIMPGGGTFSVSSESGGGLEGYSYNEVRIYYEEGKDRIVVNLKDRNNYPDVTYTLSRKVEGDTVLNEIGICGREYASNGWNYDDGAWPTYIQWLSVDRFHSEANDELDVSTLYRPYEIVNHSNQDFRLYQPNLLSVQCRHESSFGGDPYALIDNSNYAWESNIGASTRDYIELLFSTTMGQNITNDSYTHYDSGHDDYLSAAKLSHADYDDTNKYFASTASSGWVGIRFNKPEQVGAFRILNTTYSGAMPKNFSFMGSDYHPRLGFDKADVLCSGVMPQTDSWFPILVDNNKYYNYYILKIDSTYSNQPIRIRRWELMERVVNDKSYASQIRLLPNQANHDMFPKEILLQGSEDGYIWRDLTPWTPTYTPFIQHIAEYGFWQRYSFYNTYGSNFYKLKCRGNWGNVDDKISISELSLHELESEVCTNRILSGNNNIRQVWATPSNNAVFLSNSFINKLINNEVVYSEALPPEYTDFNVM